MILLSAYNLCIIGIEYLALSNAKTKSDFDKKFFKADT